MKAVHPLSFITIGFALFAMFFGSGNLIYPLFLGQLAGDQWGPAVLGFITTAVAVPIMGVIAMVLFHGDYGNFFSSLGKKFGFLAVATILIVWIPLGSGPRCATLAYASMLPYLEAAPPLWLFCGVYCLFTLWIAYKKTRMLDALGYILTPALLLSLAVIIFKGIDFSNISEATYDQSLFVLGIKEGYNTMDLIAAFFFSASIIEILRAKIKDESLTLSTTFKGALVASMLLALVYVGLVCLSATHASILLDVPKEQLLVHLAKVVLGPQLGIVASAAVFLACLTTSVALTSVFSDFLAEKVFKSPDKFHVALVITQFVTFVMSLTGLKGIAFVTEPILQIFYPLLMAMVVYNIGRKWLLESNVPAKSEVNDEVTPATD